MYSRDNINFCCQRTDLGDLTSIRTLVIFEDHLTDSLLLVLIYSLSQYCQPFFLLSKCLSQSLCQYTDILLTSLLIIGKYRFFHLFWRNDLFDRCKQLFRNCTACILMLLFSNFSYNRINEGDDLLVHFMSHIDCFDHLSFRNLISSGLDHDYFLSGGCNGQVQIAALPLLLARVDHKLAIDHTYLSHCTRSVKRNVRDAGCDCCTQHSHQLRTAGRVNTHNHIVQGYIISVILREQRTHRAVDNTGCQDRIFRCFTLSLVESSRNLSDRIHFLFIFYTQREEINSIPRLVRCSCSRQNNCITVVHESCTICLSCNTTNINSQSSACQLHCVTFVHNCISFLNCLWKIPKLLKRTEKH